MRRFVVPHFAGLAMLVSCEAMTTKSATPATVTMADALRDGPAPSPGPSGQVDARWRERCALHLLDVCAGPSDDGVLELCGAAYRPSVGERYVLYDNERVRSDLGTINVTSVDAKVDPVSFRVVGKIPSGWLGEDHWPTGAIGPWDENLGLGGGKFVWGAVVSDLGTWQVSYSFVFSGGMRLEHRQMLERCDSIVSQTRFLQAGHWCVTESAADLPDVTVRLPPRCTSARPRARGSRRAP